MPVSQNCRNTKNNFTSLERHRTGNDDVRNSSKGPRPKDHFKGILDRSVQYTAPANRQLNHSVIEPRTSSVANKNKLLVIPRTADLTGFVSLDLNNNGYISLQN